MATTLSRSRAPASAERIFIYIWSAAAVAMIVAGFFPTWFGRAWTANPPSAPLTPFVWLHGLVFTAWIALFLTQLSLIGSGNRALHMRLGKSALGFAALLLVIGVLAGIHGGARGAGPPDMPADVFIMLPVISALALAPLIALGYRYRFEAHVHKRMMLFAIAVTVGPGSGRIWGFFGTFAVPVLMVLAIWLFDLATRRRIERRVLGGGAIAMGAYLVPLAIGNTAPSRALGQWIIGLWPMAV